MKPFEYRGINPATKDWVYGHYALVHDGQGNDVDCIWIPGTERGIPIIPETLGVKIEVQDGVDIYVGDRYYCQDMEETHTVDFDEMQFRAYYNYETYYEETFWEGLHPEDIYVGTIHDHLLKENNHE